jgi:hypothetical protein
VGGLDVDPTAARIGRRDRSDWRDADDLRRFERAGRADYLAANIKSGQGNGAHVRCRSASSAE